MLCELQERKNGAEEIFSRHFSLFSYYRGDSQTRTGFRVRVGHTDGDLVKAFGKALAALEYQGAHFRFSV